MTDYTGTNSSDTLIDTSGEGSTIYSGNGNDVVDGGTGDDTIDGGNGKDILLGNLGNDLLIGANGVDIVYGGEGDDEIGSAANLTSGENGADIIYGDGYNTFQKNADGSIQLLQMSTAVGNDLLYGSNGADTIYGDNGGGDYSGVSGLGNDILYGGNGNDKIYGEVGNDIIIGGQGADILTGGSGKDIFVFNPGDNTTTSQDSITDFVAGQDNIDVTGLLGDGEVQWGYTDPTANGIWFEVVDGNTYIHVDTDGDTSTSEAVIQVNGEHNFSNQDFTGTTNEAPVNATPTTAQTLNEDQTLTFNAANGNAITVSDADANTTLTVTLSATHGTLTLPTGVTGLVSITGDGTSTLALVGAPSAINTALEGLVYTADANYNGSATIQVTSSDGFDKDVDVINLTVNAVNDAPENTVSGQKTVDEDAAVIFNDLSVSDSTDTSQADSTDRLSTTVSVLHGTLTAVAVDDGTTLIGNGTASVTIEGTAAQINAALNGLSYAPTANYNGGDTLTLTTRDNGNTGGGELSDEDMVAITVHAINDAPVNTVSSAQSVNEDASLVFSTANSNALSVSDATDTSQANSTDSLSTTISVAHGILTVASGSGASVLLDGSSSVTISGTAAQINATLEGLRYDPTANYNGGDTLMIVTRDNGNTGGGELTDTDTVAITVNPVNDAPQGTNATLTVNEDVPYALKAADFGFNDPVEGNALAAVKIVSLASEGTLKYNGAAITQAEINAGYFVSKADIDAGQLTFVSALNANGANYASFSFQVQDDGGTAHGGVDLAPTTNTITFNVNAVNDAPQGTNSTLTVNEDVPYALKASDFGFSDPVEGNTLAAVKIVSLATPGTLKYNGNVITQTQIDAGLIVGKADIDAGKLTFVSALNGNGTNYAGFNFQVQDNGGTANGGVDLDPSANTISFNVTAVNDPATITGTATGAVTEATDASLGSPTISGDLLATDVDNPNDSFQAVNNATASTNGYGSYTVTSAGVWEYTLNNSNPTVNALNDNQPLNDSFVVRSADGTSKTVNITINGATDDTTPPSVTSVSYGNNDGTLKAGESVAILLTFNENILVNTAGGAPTLSLNSGGTAVYGGVSGNVMIFNYTVAAGQNADDLAITRFNHNNAIVGDAAGNNVYLGDLNWNPDSVLRVDTVAPTFTPAVFSPFSFTYVVDFSIAAEFTENVYDVWTKLIGGWWFPNLQSETSQMYNWTGAIWISYGITGFGGEAGRITVQFNASDASGNNVNELWRLNLSVNSSYWDGYISGTVYQLTSSWAKISGPAGVAGESINMGLSDPTPNVADDLITLDVTHLPVGWSLNSGSDIGNGLWTVQTTDPGALAVTTPADFTGAALLNVNMSWTNADGSAGSLTVHDNVEVYAPGNPIFAWSMDDHLTGSTYNDTFVFGQPIGADFVYNFDTVADKIDLMGFAGFGSFADVQAHLSADANGDAVLTLADGQTITFVGVDPTMLGEGNFAFNENPLTHNPGNMTIGDGAMLPLGGLVDNTGTIALDSAGQGATLQVIANGMTLQGGGHVVLSDDDGNQIAGTTPEISLTNVDNTISGAGQLGAAQMTLVNEGVIDADGAHALVIDTGLNTIVNTGTLESSGSGGLVIESDVDNTDGQLWAHGGGITAHGDVAGGVALIDFSGSIEFGAAASSSVTFGDAAEGGVNTLKLDDADSFSGSVTGLNADDLLDFGDVDFATSSWSYTANGEGTGGTLSVTDGVDTANVTLIGQYSAVGFNAAGDLSGGTLVSYDPALAV